MENSAEKNYEAIILFDGICNFCNSSVDVIIRHDPQKYFKFTALQSEAGERLLKEHKIDATKLDTLILIEDEVVYTHSTAVLKIFRKLHGWYPLLYDFIVVPIFIRDPLYQLFAKYRYRIFGKREKCRIPTKNELSRFI